MLRYTLCQFDLEHVTTSNYRYGIEAYNRPLYTSFYSLIRSKTFIRDISFTLNMSYFFKKGNKVQAIDEIQIFSTTG